MTDQYEPDPVEFNARVVEEFRANDGRLSGIFAKSYLLLLTTTGARTGRKRTTPMGHWSVDGDLVVVASGNGSAKTPDWFHNLSADPNVDVELATPDGVDRFHARARVLEGAEHDARWPHLLEQAPFFAEHQSRIDRQIPVVVLERA